MKSYVNNIKNVWKKNWKNILIRFFIYFLGVYLFGLGISLYLNTRVGLSHIDLSIYSFIVITQNISDGQVSSDQIDQFYSLYLTILYLLLFVVCAIMKIIKTVIDYKLTKNKELIVQNTVLIILDIIPIFLWPLAVTLNSLYIPIETIGNMSIFARTWIFMAAFFIYTLGISMTVYSNLLPGPYNSLSSNFCELIKINYAAARIIFDVVIASVGIFAILISNPPGIGTFWNNYFGFGTIFMMVLSGFGINYILKIFKKLENKFKIK